MFRNLTINQALKFTFRQVLNQQLFISVIIRLYLNISIVIRLCFNVVFFVFYKFTIDFNIACGKKTNKVSWKQTSLN